MIKTDKPQPNGRGRGETARKPRRRPPISVGGVQRRRHGGTWRQMGKTRMMVPPEAALSDGVRLPKDPATPKQTKALDELIYRFLRLREVRRLQDEDLPPEMIAKVINVSDRTAYTLVKEACQLGPVLEVHFVLEVLDGMMEGRYAGVLATRKTALTIWLFKLMHYLDPRECRGRGLHPDNEDDLRKRHAAFRLDYRDWINRTN